MTKEQEDFLTNFADTKLAEIAQEEARVAEVEEKRIKDEALAVQIAEIKARKEAELQAELEALKNNE